MEDRHLIVQSGEVRQAAQPGAGMFQYKPSTWHRKPFFALASHKNQLGWPFSYLPWQMLIGRRESKELSFQAAGKVIKVFAEGLWVFQ